MDYVCIYVSVRKPRPLLSILDIPPHNLALLGEITLRRQNSSLICSELSSGSLRGKEVKSFLALHSLLRERVVRGEPSGVSANGRVVARIIELKR